MLHSNVLGLGHLDDPHEVGYQCQMFRGLEKFNVYINIDTAKLYRTGNSQLWLK
jgi:hypothetical protein